MQPNRWETKSLHGKIIRKLTPSKVVEIEPEGRAPQQIEDKGYAEGYADKYRIAGQPIRLVGVEFSRRERRRVVGFEARSIDVR